MRFSKNNVKNLRLLKKFGFKKWGGEKEKGLV